MIINVIQQEDSKSNGFNSSIVIPFSRYKVNVFPNHQKKDNVLNILSNHGEVKVLDKENNKDVTKSILGVDTAYSCNGYELMAILNKVFEFENK